MARFSFPNNVKFVVLFLAGLMMSFVAFITSISSNPENDELKDEYARVCTYIK